MFIGRIGTGGFPNGITSGHVRMNRLSAFAEPQSMEKRLDYLKMGSQRTQDEEFSGIYKPEYPSAQAFAGVTYTRLAPDEGLKVEILPPSERSSYTERDALMNQYLKQYRLDGHFEGDAFIQDSSGPVRLVLPEQVTEDDLESFRQELNENGAAGEIDWGGVKNDLVQMSVGFDNAGRLDIKADYLASRYAVLKNRIQNQFTGDRQGFAMQKLEQLYTEAKEQMADSYADSIGGFYERLGQSGAASEMRNSIWAGVDERAAEYEKYLEQAGDYADLNESSDQWLRQDDAYMASRLRESMLESPAGLEGQTVSEQTLYSMEELVTAGVYAKSLSDQLKNSNLIWNTSQDDSALGVFFAEQKHLVQEIIADADISDKMADMLTAAFEPYMEKFMDALDHSIDLQQGAADSKPWISGLFRREHIDRGRVYACYQNVVSGMQAALRAEEDGT